MSTVGTVFPFRGGRTNRQCEDTVLEDSYQCDAAAQADLVPLP